MASDKDWLSVLNNMQLYMVQAYPEEDFITFKKQEEDNDDEN